MAVTVFRTEDEEEERYASFDWQITKRFGTYLAPHKRTIGLAVFASLFSVVAQVAGPPIIAYAVDQGVEEGNLSIIGLGVLAYLLVQAGGAIGFRFQIVLMAMAGQRAIQQMRDDLFEHIQQLSMEFFTRYETGRLIARVISDVNTLREAISFAVVGTFRDMLILVGIVISMMLINLPLTGVAFVVLLVLGFIANIWRIYARKAYLRVTETNARVNAELSEAFNGVRVTQAYDRQFYNHGRFQRFINQDDRNAKVQASLVGAMFFPTIELVGAAATGTLIWVGGVLVLEEQLTIFTLLTFVLYIEQFFFPIRMLAQRYNLFQTVMASGQKIFRLLDEPVEVRDVEDAVTLPQIQGHVQFDNVSFRYDENGEWVLKDINLDIPAGTSVAFVGHTGAGKSTMIKLVKRFYDATEGQVTIDGYDIEKISQASLRGQLGVVLQDTVLFTGTVRDNIRYGRLDATDEEVIEAAKAVGAHEFIEMLEEGYDTEVREGGSLLSAGQKQLISFARALLADPRILILDEATSNIDTGTERIIQTALLRLMEGRTSFVIAHRLSTIVASDIIVVMDHGEIVEMGTHEELLAKGGMYTSMYTMAE